MARCGGWEWILVLFAALTSGCAVLERERSVAVSTDGYGTAKIVYELAGDQLTAVWNELSPGAPGSDGGVATLTVTYPHPDGDPQLAMVNLTRLDSPPTGARLKLFRSVTFGRTQWHEWEMSISKETLDALLAELNAAGYFADSPETDEASRIKTQIDGAKADRSWRASPMMNDLVAEIRRRGRPVTELAAAEMIAARKRSRTSLAMRPDVDDTENWIRSVGDVTIVRLPPLNTFAP